VGARSDDAASGTRSALGTGALGALLTLVAALLDAEPLYVPGIAFVLIAGGAATWVLLGARGITVHRDVTAARVVEDECLRVVIDVRAGRIALPTGAVHDDLLPAPAPLAVGRRGTRVRINARFARRGRRLLAPPRIVVRDPFGLAARVVSAGAPREVLVLPRIEPVAAVAAGGDGTGLGLRRRRRPTVAEVELDGIGPLRPGTPASRIHWPSIARRAEPQERRLHADGDRLPLVVLDPRAATGGDEEEAELDVDAAVRAAASLAVHLARSGGCHVLLPGDRRPVQLDPTLGGWPRLHARLALVQGTDTVSVGAMAGRLGPVIYVSARRVRRAPRALLHHGGGGRVLVVPGGVPGRRPAFTVAGCAGHELAVGGAVAGAA
jgi:uncharacterized protein (DUF58 family)